MAAIFVIPFEAPGKWGMKGTSVHSYTAGQGQPRGDKHGAEEDIRDPNAVVSAAHAEVTPANPIFDTGACLQNNENGEIICIIFILPPLVYCIKVLLGFLHKMQLMGKKTKIKTSHLDIFVSFSGMFTSGTS